MSRLLTEPDLKMTAWDIHSWEEWRPYVESLEASQEIILIEYEDLGCIILK